jgi:hypothetical protein
MSIIMGDYVAGFLGSSEGCNWNMNAFDVGQCSLATWVVANGPTSSLSKRKSSKWIEDLVTTPALSSTFFIA